jgi:hypothetical protein
MKARALALGTKFSSSSFDVVDDARAIVRARGDGRDDDGGAWHQRASARARARRRIARRGLGRGRDEGETRRRVGIEKNGREMR